MQTSALQVFVQDVSKRIPLARWAAELKQSRLGARLFTNRAIILGLELILVIGCAYQVSNLFWAIAAPSSSSSKAAVFAQAPDVRPFQSPQSLYIATTNIFQPLESSGGATPVVAAPATTLNLQLFGVRSGGPTGRGSAIIRKPDNTQDVFFVGQNIIDGVILERIEADHVVIRRMGILESLYLDQARAIAAPSQPAAPMAQTQAIPAAGSQSATADAEIPRRMISAPPAELFAALQVVPAKTKSGVVGLSVQPRGDVSVFNDAGFQAGDVLLAVNGQVLSDVARLPALVEGLAASRSFIVELDRGGTTLTQRFVVDR